MTRLVMQRAMQPAFLADIMKYQDGADEITGPVTYRRGGIANGDFLAAAADLNGVLGQSEHLPFSQASRHGAFGALARVFIDHAEDIIDEMTLSFTVFPSGQTFGDGIEVIDAPFRIGCDDGVADRLQSHLRTLFCLKHGSFRFLALGDIGQRAFEADDSAGLVAYRAAVVDYHEHAAVFTAHDVFLVA